MEFNEKLQELRKQKGMTQEELAEKLYVSRTAISKWESGRGYPNLESLKAISQFFHVSLDDLLSSNALLTIAEAENRQNQRRTRTLLFGLLDCCMGLLLFLPFFAQRADGEVQAVSLLLLGAAPYVKVPCLILVSFLVVWGILTLALQSSTAPRWLRWKERISLAASVLAVLCFILSLQPYAAAFAFVFLIIKALLLAKQAMTRSVSRM